MKYILALCTILSACMTVSAQTSNDLTIEDCYQSAKQHYPLIKQSDILVKSRDYSIDNISKSWYPQVNLNGQASYQSAVTEIPIKVPNINIESPSKDQYKVYAEATQTIYDGGFSKLQKQLVENTALVEEQQLEVELYRLKERINQLFFGVLLIDEQLNQVQIIKKDIESGMRRVQGAVNNGAALKSSVDVLKAELLKNQQRETEMRSGRKAFLKMLSLFTGKQIDENTNLAKPASFTIAPTISRPELNLYDLQKRNTIVQDKLLTSRNLPKVGLFLQAGYGKPALNFLKNSFEPYYIGGLRISWSLTGLYTEKNDRQRQDLNRTAIDIQKETFLFNTNLSLAQLTGDIEKLNELIKTDNEIIALRLNIKNTANAQLTYGTITSNDYLREVNAEDQARQTMLLHQIQLLMTEHSYKITAGN